MCSIINILKVYNIPHSSHPYTFIHPSTHPHILSHDISTSIGQRYLEVSRALNGEDEEYDAALLEGAVELELVAGRGGPDTPLLRQLNVAQVAALHYEVAHR